MNLPKILKYARKISKQSDHPAHQLSAILFDRKGRIYSAGNNWHTKTHPEFHKITKIKTLHAEAAAILAIRHKTDFSKLQLLVYREHKSGDLALSKPCEYCMQLIKNYGIKTIWYTDKDGIKKEAV